MSEHRWGEPDKDGVMACLRGGCTVRAWDGGWQEKKRTRWLPRLPTTPLPPCTGTDAPEATECAHDWVTECGVRYCRKCPALPPEPTPSPLEVVRKALMYLGTWSLGANVRSTTALAALATLEESIRADEREACAEVAERSRRDAVELLAAGSHRADKLAAEATCAEEIRDAIRARRKR